MVLGFELSSDLSDTVQQVSVELECSIHHYKYLDLFSFIIFENLLSYLITPFLYLLPRYKYVVDKFLLSWCYSELSFIIASKIVGYVDTFI